MILLTDGGSTKCDWILLDSQGSVVLRTRTLGLNPAVVHADELSKRVADNLDMQIKQTTKLVEAKEYQIKNMEENS